jgi:hypothetical protein
VQPHAPDTLQTPARVNLTFLGRIKQSLWAIGDRLKERNLKYAFKAGMATALLAAPAFFDSTRPLFMEYNGQWALISVSLCHIMRMPRFILACTVFRCHFTNHRSCKLLSLILRPPYPIQATNRPTSLAFTVSLGPCKSVNPFTLLRSPNLV